MIPVRRRLPAIEAVALVVLAQVATKLLGSPRLMRVLGDTRPPRRTPHPQQPETFRRARRVGRTVERVSDRLPWHPVCLPQALATRTMLRRRGIACEMHLGITSTTPLAAHAWVTAGGQVVQGGPVDHVTPLATLR